MDRGNTGSKKKTKERIKVPWKIVFTLFFVGMLILGYVYKLNKVEVNHYMKEKNEKK
jgi:preprotein translocase subunit SecG